MESFLGEFILIFLLILFNGFFSGSEIAVISMRKSRVQQLLDEGNKSAKYIDYLQTSSDKFLATVQIGVTVVGSLASAVGGATIVQGLKLLLGRVPLSYISKASEPIAIGVVVVGISYLSLVLGELVPKSLALKYTERFALIVARPVYWLSKAAHVFVGILTTSSNLILKPFRDKTSFAEPHISEEEIEYMLEEGAKVGLFEATEKELIQSVFEFTDTVVKEIMVPRPNIVAIDVDSTQSEIIRVVTEEGYSRLPVYKGTVDHIVGVIYAKDIINLLEYGNLIILHDIIRPAYFVPGTKKISQLMREFQKRKIHMAVVVDEFGGTEGIVTMEDILEEIVGEIHDEYDEVEKEYEVSSDGSLLVDALMRVDDFNIRFDAGLPKEGDYETVGGFLNVTAGHIPELGEEIKYDNMVFVVTQKDEHRVQRVKVKRPGSSAGNDAGKN